MNNEVDPLLEAWEETYKKGQLTLWIFLALKEEPKYVEEIKLFVETTSNGTMRCEEQSLYRTLRKYRHIDVVDFETRKGFKGPDRKYYFLTELGKKLLSQFLSRNIALFFNENVRNLIEQEA
ncbi:PadR family transcriptional regulator [Prolixibacteraceae bacterium]|uniref:PadR family transcriptional regulator n=1 Tax=Halosquirtibacter xylanolyticus TaxID=3374599 RepID=UPI003748A3D7|nr:PadR family transcriptional regulator [Prolixibacteraceae bacterium]QZT36899.1 PadR family transcriptional regulator [Prolixibacteraceae bacterium]